MIDAKREELDFIKKTIHTYVSNCEIRAFGSRVKGNAKRYSDIDICLVAPEKIDIAIIGSIKEQFALSDLPYRVDILDWKGIGDNFKKIIEEKYEEIN